MISIDLSPYRVALGEADLTRLLLVGVGGTGSTLALFLGGLLYHAREQGTDVELTLVDHDTVEPANVGRQAFAPAEVGRNKALSMALRLNADYGLAVTAWPERLSADLGRRWVHQAPRGRRCRHLIIGCVDTHTGRLAIAETVATFSGRVWALDCGNERHNGQVLIGNLADPRRIEASPLGLASGLPSPYVQEPDLLTPPPAGDALSCAALPLEGAQSLMVNRLAAAVAGQVVTRFVLRREVTSPATFFGLEPLAMTSKSPAFAADLPLHPDSSPVDLPVIAN